MSDGFVELIDRSIQFFTELAANNTKDFYEPRKAFYTADIKKPAELMGDLLAEDLSRLTGAAHGRKLFRIHRDVRFSKDKTPYNAHLHLMWSQSGDARPAWFFGAARDYLILGMGIMGLDSAGLTAFRAFVDAQGDDLADAMQGAGDSVGATVSDWGPDPLKRVPKPYAADHPHGELLKRKALAMSAPLPPDWREAGVVASVQQVALGLLPVWRLLNDRG